MRIHCPYNLTSTPTHTQTSLVDLRMQRLMSSGVCKNFAYAETERMSDRHAVSSTGCNVSTRQRLQRVQNRAVHLVLNAPPRTPSLPLLQQLHWLPVEARITYKLCLLMYHVVHRTAPQTRTGGVLGAVPSAAV